MMQAVAETTHHAAGRRPRDRLAAGFLLVLMLLGCVVTWVGVPVACMWAAGELTDGFGTHFLIALPMTVLTILLCMLGLFWLNRLYLRVTLGSSLEIDAEGEEDEEERTWMRGPLEPMLVGSIFLGLIALFAWFFFLAENPPPQVI
jgi:NADH:ubiquinone oxidoreductase subunit 5 (subunit L)/multisubunit Na+/H+ antiporter MnhA subunit